MVRVTVNIPRSTRSLMTLALEQRKANDLAESRLAKLEEQMKRFRDTDDRCIEDGVAGVVAEKLGEGEVVVTQYDFKGEAGDLGALVVGRWEGKDVIVLVNAKNNMDTFYRKALAELSGAMRYWEKLKNLSAEELEEEDALASDYHKLQLANYSSYSVMLAFGGNKFSKHVAQTKLAHLQTPWFYVVADPTGRFLATHSKQLP
ncbi:hypothetical protein PLESTM_000302100 [Pleodorina starrii]|nr:hypothetical protein PLESTM_000302100 [Pleodorina starrii]